MLNWTSRGPKAHRLWSSVWPGADPEDGAFPVPSCCPHPQCVSQLDLHADQLGLGLFMEQTLLPCLTGR